MIKRLLSVTASFWILAGLAALFAADSQPGSASGANQPPSEASIKQLLEITRVHKMIDSTMTQMDAFMTQAMKQATQGQPVTADVQKQIDKSHADIMAMMKETLDWAKLEPMYVRVYQKSFTQQEVDNMIAMYQTPGGQALLNKMPVVMQNTMAEMQQMMQPVMQRIQQMQQQVAAQVQAEKSKKGS
jgi:uncharacterized protein